MGKCLGALVGCHLGGRPFVRSLGVVDRSCEIRPVRPYYLSWGDCRNDDHTSHHIYHRVYSHCPSYSPHRAGSRHRVHSRFRDGNPHPCNGPPRVDFGHCNEVVRPLNTDRVVNGGYRATLHWVAVLCGVQAPYVYSACYTHIALVCGPDNDTLGKDTLTIPEVD